MDGKVECQGTITVENTGVEYTLCEIPQMEEVFFVFGLIDVSELQPLEAIKLRWYASADGVNQRLLYKEVYVAPFTEPLIYIQQRFFPRKALVKITLEQISGTPRSFPYTIVAIALDVGVKKWLLRSIA